MIPLIGYIVAVYAIARLLLVWLESLDKKSPSQLFMIFLMAVAAAVIIAFLAYDLSVIAGRSNPQDDAQRAMLDAWRQAGGR